MRIERGFTLIELVAVMVIAAVLAITATAMFDRRTFATATFADQVRAQLAYGRKAAIAARRPVVVTVTGTTVALNICTTFACGATTALAPPQGGASFISTAPSGVSLTVIPNFTFDAQGGTAAQVQITITGDTPRTVTVSGGTGYVF